LCGEGKIVLFLWLKSLHIVGVVVWFAGLFYLVRLFIYHQELIESAEEESLKSKMGSQFSLMEQRLLHLITTPGAIFATLMAVGLIWLQPGFLEAGWLHFKLAIVGVLYGYHYWCIKVTQKLKSNQPLKWSSQVLRFANEVPTFLLLGGVMLVVFKSQFPTSAASWFFGFLTILIFFSIQKYAKFRKKKRNSTLSPTH
jgi:putative membrane protein